MRTRIASSAVGLPLLWLAVWAGGVWFSVLVAAAAAMAALEVCDMARRRGRRPAPYVAVVGSVGLVAAAHVARGDLAPPLPALAAAAALASVVWLLRRPGPTGWPADVGVTVSAVLYPGALLFYGPLLRRLDHGFDWVLVAVLVTFAADTTAFFVGRSLGRRALAPSLSPGKTWEGAIGGVAGAAAMGAASALAFDLGVTLASGLLLGAMLGVVGQLGDLGESVLKRAAGVKDSGRIIPGHGGMLDRLDSIVFNLALVYYSVVWAVQ